MVTLNKGWSVTTQLGIDRDLFTHVHAIRFVQFWMLLVQLFPNFTQMCVIIYSNQMNIIIW